MRLQCATRAEPHARRRSTETVFAGERCRYLCRCEGGTSMVLKEPSSAAIRRRVVGESVRDRLVGRGHGHCLRHDRCRDSASCRLPRVRPWQRMRRRSLLVAPLVALHAGVLRAAGRGDAAAQRRRSELDAGELRGSLRRYASSCSVFWTTLRTALIVTLGTLLLGYPVALALSRLRRWRGDHGADPGPAAVLDQRAGAQLRLDGAAGPQRR